ncbi:MAG TPA: hypothetical protein PLI62_04180 [Spirochaetota bacterium]|nr:hypothetical protein [Spirochaetota bacterium]HQP48676.1 hypothetical protein [Spirochaetota bacterium]
MDRQWYTWFFRIVELRESNFLSVGGGLVTLLSLVFPWYVHSYIATKTSVSGAEILFGYFFNGATIPWFSAAAIIYLILVSLFVIFFAGPAHTFFAALSGTAAFLLMLFFNPVPLSQFTWGLGCTLGGLVLMSCGIIRKEETRQ